MEGGDGRYGREGGRFEGEGVTVDDYDVLTVMMCCL